MTKTKHLQKIWWKRLTRKTKNMKGTVLLLIAISYIAVISAFPGPNFLRERQQALNKRQPNSKCIKVIVKAMDDTGVVMTPFGDVVTVILVVNTYVLGFLCLKSQHKE